jgi:type VI secretion system secreted protein VgrG
MQKEKLFKFNTPEFPDYNLEVVSFKGHEEVGELYSYEINLLSTNSDIDLDKILQTDVSLQILHRNNREDIYIHGVLAYFEISDKINNYIHYKAHLVPKLWKLSMSPYSQIFLNKSIPDIIEDVLKQGKLTTSDYEFSLQDSYDKREYVCQYDESRYDFVKRWMQRVGIYFYFQDGEDGCKMLITDDKSRHQEFPNNDKMPYKQASGLQSYEEQTISNLIYRSNTNPKSVRMKNFHYEKPSVNLDFNSNSSEQKYDEAYMYGNNIHSQSEVKKLTQINQQRYDSTKKELLCSSNIIYIKPGYIYKLSDYFKADLNTTYLDVKLESEGSQRGFMSAGFTQESDDASYYSNTFSMISSQVQYRMQKDTPWPKISGMMSATIDSQGSGETAQIDEYGRYKVKMPFDLSERNEMKASAYIRMSQSSAGEKQGIHFPLHKGTEVLIAFKGADPDQPIIMGAVPNINSPSPVTDKNLEKSIIQTHGGNTVEMNDTPGDGYIKLSVRDNASSIKIHNESDDSWGIEESTRRSKCSTVGGNSLSTVIGARENITLLGNASFSAGLSSKTALSAEVNLFIGYLRKWIIGYGKKFASDGLHTFTTTQKSFSLKKTDVAGDASSVSENTISLSEDSSEVTTKETKMSDTKITISTEETSIIERHNTIVNSTDSIAEDSNSLAGTSNSFSNDANISSSGSTNLLSSGSTNIISNSTNIAADSLIMISDVMLSDSELIVVG